MISPPLLSFSQPVKAKPVIKPGIRLFRLLFLVVLAFVYSSISCQEYSVTCNKPEQVTAGKMTNFFRLNPDFYRSEQPDRQEFNLIEQIGIRTIINLRKHQADQKKTEDKQFILIHIPLNAKKMSYQDVRLVLKTIEEAEKPVLVHCLHGSDRTGCISAAYRMVYEGMPREEAIREFENKAFGYHKILFPNLLDLLNSLDVERLKSDLEKGNQTE